MGNGRARTWFLGCLGPVAGLAAALAIDPADALALEPKTLVRAAGIRTEVTARYWSPTRARLTVTDATATGVVRAFTLIDDWRRAPRTVAADNGIYFAICSTRATCPFELRAIMWPRDAFLPRRQALELALRSFAETSANLVVVLLPTADPLWVVFQRHELIPRINAAALLRRLSGRPHASPVSLRKLVFSITRPRLYKPLPILPPPRETIYAVRLFRR